MRAGVSKHAATVKIKGPWYHSVFALNWHRSRRMQTGQSGFQHYDARSPSGSKFSARDCLAALLKSRPPGKS